MCQCPPILQATSVCIFRGQGGGIGPCTLSGPCKFFLMLKHTLHEASHSACVMVSVLLKVAWPGAEHLQWLSPLAS